MQQRCYNKNARPYYLYGGRGIGVCQRWRDSFAAFLADLGPKPGLGFSIDRIDNQGDYEPSNCRWATNKQQRRNQRGYAEIVFKGQSLPLSEWAARIGIARATLRYRLRHWSRKRALTTPPNPKLQRKTKPTASPVL